MLLLTLPILWIKIVGENGQINVNFWFPPWDLPSDLEIFGDSHMLHTKTEGDHLWYLTYPCWFWSVCQYFSWNLFLVNILDVDLLVYLVGNLFFPWNWFFFFYEFIVIEEPVSAHLSACYMDTNCHHCLRRNGFSVLPSPVDPKAR